MLVAALAVAPAAAADKPKPKGTETGKPQAMQPMARSMQPMDTFKAQMQAYMDTMASRQLSIDAINQTFADAVKKAQRDYRTTRAAATTAEAKTAADAARKLAIADATVTRQRALDALGPAPEKPEKPEKPTKPTPTPTPTP